MGIKSFVLGSALVAPFRQPAMSLNEIVPGVDKPSLILARMLVAEMLQNLDVKVSREEYTSMTACSCAFPSFIIRFYESKEKGSTSNNRVPYEISQISFKQSKFEKAIGADERAILLEGVKTFAKLHKERASLTAEERRQETALLAIESFFKTKETEPSPSPSATPVWAPSPASSASVATTTSSAGDAVTSCLGPVETSYR